MRPFLIGVFALGLAGPAFAQDRAPQLPAVDAQQLSSALSTPLVQEGLAATVDEFADALLQTHVGPLAHYADPRANVRPDNTLGDLAARSNPNYRRDLHESARGAIAATGRAMQDVASMSAELKRTSDRIHHLLDQTRAEMESLR
ncbi:hypothetical protein [uncultured Sphingomonas sp.]|uniref:hypothetical protein n=1 Tax=uncultured Sphingomonas sp. TaxID=158754 RepID=UPI0030FC0B65